MRGRARDDRGAGEATRRAADELAVQRIVRRLVHAQPVAGQHPKIRDRIRDSGELRAEIEAARAWGISRRRFLGWEPRRITRYEHDDEGRIVRSITETEPEWDDNERAWAIALLEVEADTCKGCGQPLSETLQPEAYQGYEASDGAACQGCKAVRRKQDAYAKAKDPDLPILRFAVTRTWQPPDIDAEEVARG